MFGPYRSLACAVTLAFVWLTALPVQARYMQPQLEQVPVERLVENLTKQAEANPKDAAVRFNLARVHAMAYALKTDSVQVRKGEPNAWFGFEPKNVPFQAQKTDDAEKAKAAEAQLALAVADYQKALELNPDLLSAQLGYAWCLDQQGKKVEAIKEYRQTIEKGWEKEKDATRGGLGKQWLVVEAGEYLKPLLDPQQDQAELAQLAERTAKLNKLPRPVTPIAIPLREGLTASDIEDRSARVRFDADGSGERKQWSWIKPNAAWLVYDQRGDGRPDSALQLFGNVTFWCFWDNGYQALRALDNDGDGKLTGTELRHLALWHDANGNGIADTGEVMPLAEYGIAGLSCEFCIDDSHPDRIPYSPTGVKYTNGETRPTFDVLLHQKP